MRLALFTHWLTRFARSFPCQLPFVPKIDPYPLKFLYNMSQMMLCAYMTVEAGLVAYRSGYSVVPCQAFDMVNPPVGKVLYIFYLSKGERERHR